MPISNITANLSNSSFKIKNNDVYINNPSGNPGLLLIHASWCGHCKNFIPTFQSICNRLNKNNDDFPCVAIEDKELNTDGGYLANALDVNGYPTLKFFDQYGKIIGDYNGKRDPNSLLDTICKVYHRCITKY